MESKEVFSHLARGLRFGPLAMLLALLLLGACNQGDSTGPSSGRKTIISADGALEFQVPASWSEESDLNAAASLQAADRGLEAYGVVIEDPRGPFQSVDLHKFADTEIHELAARVGLANLSGPDPVSIEDHEAIQYRLRGFADEVEVIYLYTFVETPDRFLKVITWSLADRFEQNRPTLEEVAASVRQLKPIDSPDEQGTGGGPPDAESVPTGDPDVVR